LTKRPLYYATENFHVPMICGRPASEVIAETISAFECFAPEDSCIYLSSEITTGQRFYSLLREHGVRSRDELKQKLGVSFQQAWKHLMDQNLFAGQTFFQEMNQGGHRNLINPGPFFAKGWEQEHYLYLWEWVIVHKCCETRFNSGWNYSNGCTLEYAISLRKSIPRRHKDNRSLDATEAIALIEAALADLGTTGIDTPALRLNLQRIKEAAS
jgi:hypothetical protein